MLTVHEDAVAFRHELARRAVEESLTALGARGRHARVLAALQTLGADPARLVHHAERAGDDETLAQVAPEAARSAATSSAHREAAELHQIEIWRDRLLAEGDEALAEWVALYPAADRQHLRQLVRNALAERAKNKPPHAYRELFRALRELADGTAAST